MSIGVGDCFISDVYGEPREYLVVERTEVWGDYNYNLYSMPLVKGAPIEIRQNASLDCAKLQEAIELENVKQIVNLHWITFDELTEMLVGFGKEMKVIGFAAQDHLYNKTRHLFIEHKGRIIQITVPQVSTFDSKSMLKYVYCKVITREDFEAISKDIRWEFKAYEREANPKSADVRDMYNFIGFRSLSSFVEVHGVIINDDFAIIDYDDWAVVNRAGRGLCTSYDFDHYCRIK